MSETDFDLVVIGGGPGGDVAAIRACQLGMKVALVEDTHLGGVCLNWGCIPTKTLLRTSEINYLLGHLQDFGLSARNISFDLEKIVKRSRNIAEKLQKGVEHLLNKNKVSIFYGKGKLGAKGIVFIEKNDKKIIELGTTNIILATGARARTLTGMEPDGKLIWTYREAMVPDFMPESLLVVGSGAIGMEFASFYNDLGVEVTVVEVKNQILPEEDNEISDFARKSFENQGMNIFTEANITALRRAKNNVTAEIMLKNGAKKKLLIDRAILAVGIVGNIEDIGIENTKIKVENSHVITNEWGETGEQGVYAIGDLTGAPWLAHKASHEGIICVEHIAGISPKKLQKLNIPGCTYCRPQIASVGLTELKAKEQGKNYKVGKFPLLGNGKAIALGDSEGLIKTIFDTDTGELLGAHMIGPEVTEQINGFVIAKSGEMTEEELMHSVFPHPTLSEAMHESVLEAYGKAIHI
ncbi:MAG: dihydrolipoyl dehydrogenase [Rhodospirillaceae bacterium]|nr:dihydrolipoyl dehydrogenase [Rhodospirillaceae bacterium]